MLVSIFVAILVSSVLTSLLKVIFPTTSIFVKKHIIFNVIIAYVLMLVLVGLYDWYLELALYTHDIDGDGFFSIDEQTTAQKNALAKVTNDTSRNLIPITGAFYSLFYGCFLTIFRKFKEAKS